MELDTLFIYILLTIEFPHRNYVTTYLLLRPDVTFAASGRSKSLKNTVILQILCQKCKRLRVYTLHNSKKSSNS